MKEENKKDVSIKTDDNGYLLGIVGALIGGTIATLPWILTYVYGGMILSIMAIIIAYGAFKGYTLMKGKIDKKLPIIVAIVSFLAVSVATLVVIPHLLLLKEYGTTNMAMFKALYSLSEFKGAIVQDYIYSLLFTGLGISGIVASIKRSIEAGDEVIDIRKPLYSPGNEDIDAIKEVFQKVGAMEKGHTINKATLMEDIKGKENVLNFLVARGIVVRKKDEYYYDLEVEQNPGKRTMKIMLITFGIVLGVIILSFLLASL